MQPAEAATFGYYLAGLAHALERELSTHRRVLASDQPVTTRRRRAGRNFLSIDRPATAKWLGFDVLGPHAQDCIASRDYLIELLSGLSIAATSWGRMAQDFFVMTTYEFQTLHLPDSIAQTSSMMPSEKNLTALEFLKSSIRAGAWRVRDGSHRSRAAHFSSFWMPVRSFSLGMGRPRAGPAGH